MSSEHTFLICVTLVVLGFTACEAYRTKLQDDQKRACIAAAGNWEYGACDARQPVKK